MFIENELADMKEKHLLEKRKMVAEHEALMEMEKHDENLRMKTLEQNCDLGMLVYSTVSFGKNVTS